MPQDAAPDAFWDPVALRRGVLIAAGIETAFFVLTIALAARRSGTPGTSEATIAAVVATLVFFPFVLPALLLGYFDRMLILAAGLAAIAAMIDVAMFFTISL